MPHLATRRTKSSSATALMPYQLNRRNSHLLDIPFPTTITSSDNKSIVSSKSAIQPEQKAWPSIPHGEPKFPPYAKSD